MKLPTHFKEPGPYISTFLQLSEFSMSNIKDYVSHNP